MDLTDKREALKKSSSAPLNSGYYIVLEDTIHNGVPQMEQLSVPFQTLEEAQEYAALWHAKKTYIAKMIETHIAKVVE